MAALIAHSGCCPEKQTENKLISWHALTQIRLAPPFNLCSCVCHLPSLKSGEAICARPPPPRLVIIIQ